jgi:hypothetical protein
VNGCRGVSEYLGETYDYLIGSFVRHKSDMLARVNDGND